VEEENHDREENGEVIVVEDDAFLEAITFFVFAFEEKGFEFGIKLIVSFYE